jgi:hypothetical protein
MNCAQIIKSIFIFLLYIMNINKIITHKYFHYTAIALMIFNIIGYISIRSMECVLVFGAASYVANHFTKNRALDIFIGLFVANVLFGCGRVKENFATSSIVDKLTDVVNECTINDGVCPEGCEKESDPDGTEKCKIKVQNAAKKALIAANSGGL